METLTVPGTLDSLDDIGAFIMAASKAAGFETKIAYRLRLAVDEIATNVITHGYEEAGITGDVMLSSELSDTALTVVLEDTAAEYDPTTRDVPDSLDLPLEERPIGGLGIFLTIRNVDSFGYERRGDRNRYTFVMNLPQH
jgi:anti-sigma regulatory factor (Ser/Thr protein kinase)